ncbi:hypothetical protein HELRODRAFT_173152 [Helobdella robusta]|uniref:Uncharacterized protein n=1 Tax=Helobdella robusta TaxID=6412 RepID=T1F6G6_HELRO|nr:hypothetical protein HELRODRAFT_173152 [Helobdella robusta]ESO04075.1 hypothetical protein HELRODRAFT_173152 [Helobdella robusta]
MKKRNIDYNKFIVGTDGEETQKLLVNKILFEFCCKLLNISYSNQISVLEDEAAIFFDSCDGRTDIVDLHEVKCLRLLINFCETNEDRRFPFSEDEGFKLCFSATIYLCKQGGAQGSVKFAQFRRVNVFRCTQEVHQFGQTEGIADNSQGIMGRKTGNTTQGEFKLRELLADELELVFSHFLLMKKRNIDYNKFIVGTDGEETQKLLVNKILFEFCCKLLNISYSNQISVLEDEAAIFFDSCDGRTDIVDLHEVKCLRLLINFCETNEDRR